MSKNTKGRVDQGAILREIAVVSRGARSLQVAFSKKPFCEIVSVSFVLENGKTQIQKSNSPKRALPYEVGHCFVLFGGGGVAERRDLQ